MTTSAIIFLVIALVIVWGGLVLSIINLRRAGAEVSAEADDEEPEGAGWSGPAPRDL